jgi:PEP-CTERM motif
VPEPSTLSLAALGALAANFTMARAIRRRARAKAGSPPV